MAEQGNRTLYRKNSQILQYKKWVNGILFVIMAIAIYGLVGFGHVS